MNTQDIRCEPASSQEVIERTKGAKPRLSDNDTSCLDLTVVSALQRMSLGFMTLSFLVKVDGSFNQGERLPTTNC